MRICHRNLHYKFQLSIFKNSRENCISLHRYGLTDIVNCKIASLLKNTYVSYPSVYLEVFYACVASNPGTRPLNQDCSILSLAERGGADCLCTAGRGGVDCLCKAGRAEAGYMYKHLS